MKLETPENEIQTEHYDNGKEYMVPLKYLTEKEALNYINK